MFIKCLLVFIDTCFLSVKVLDLVACHLLFIVFVFELSAHFVFSGKSRLLAVCVVVYIQCHLVCCLVFGWVMYAFVGYRLVSGLCCWCWRSSISCILKLLLILNLCAS